MTRKFESIQDGATYPNNYQPPDLRAPRLRGVNTIATLPPRVGVKVKGAPRPYRFKRPARLVMSSVAVVLTVIAVGRFVEVFTPPATATPNRTHTALPAVVITATPLNTATPTPTVTPTGEPAVVVASGWVSWWGSDNDRKDRAVYVAPGHLAAGVGTVMSGTAVIVCWKGQVAYDDINRSETIPEMARCTRGQAVNTFRSNELAIGPTLTGSIGAGVRNDLGVTGGVYNLLNVVIYMGGLPVDSDYLTIVRDD